MKGFALFLMVGILFAQWDNPSARIMGLGSGFAYLVPDTLTDMLINPANTPKASMVIAKPYPFPQAGAFYRGIGVWARPSDYDFERYEGWDTLEYSYYGKRISYSLTMSEGIRGMVFTAMRAGSFGLSFLLEGNYNWYYEYREEEFWSDSDSVSYKGYMRITSSSKHTGLVNTGWRGERAELSLGFIWFPNFTRTREEGGLYNETYTFRDLAMGGLATGRFLWGTDERPGSLYFQLLIGPGKYLAEEIGENGLGWHERVEIDFMRYGLNVGAMKDLFLLGNNLYLAVSARNQLDWADSEPFRMDSRLIIPVGLERTWHAGSTGVSARAGYGSYFRVSKITSRTSSQSESKRDDAWNADVVGTLSSGLGLSWGTSRFDLYNMGNLMSIGDWRVEFWKMF